MDKISSSKNYKQLIVVGLPRSGTSLLFKTICSHSEIALFYESDVFYSWPDWLCNLKKQEWGERIDLWNGHLKRHGYGGVIKSFPECSKIEAMQYLCELQSKGGAKVVGEKSAMYGSYLEKLYKVFPDAYFIVLWRDLSEIFDSVKRASRGGDSYFSTKGLFYEYLGDMTKMRKGCASLKAEGANLKQIDFRELVSSREQVCREICEFLNLDFEAEMVEAKQFDNTVIPRGMHHEGVKRGQLEKDGRGQMVSPSWMKRIQRYANLWNGEKEKVPSYYERLFCATLYYLSKWRLQFKASLYWILPVGWVKWYRERK